MVDYLSYENGINIIVDGSLVDVDTDPSFINLKSKEWICNPVSIEDIPMVKMYGSDFRPEILHMHQTITRLGYWEKLLEEPSQGGYMLGSDDWMDKIRKDPQIGADGHSGMTGSCCMRYCQYIARNGWNNFVKKHGETDNNPLEKIFG